MYNEIRAYAVVIPTYTLKFTWHVKTGYGKCNKLNKLCKFNYFAIVEDDWELSHRKLTGINDEGTQGSQVTDWVREKDTEKGGPKSSKSRDEQRHLQEDFEDELNREEVKVIWFVEPLSYYVLQCSRINIPSLKWNNNLELRASLGQM